MGKRGAYARGGVNDPGRPHRRVCDTVEAQGYNTIMVSMNKGMSLGLCVGFRVGVRDEVMARETVRTMATIYVRMRLRLRANPPK